MSSLRTWFRGSSAPSSSKASREHSPAVSASASTTAVSTHDSPSATNGTSTPSVNSAIAREIADMEDAMASTALLLNDDMEGAEARLRARKDSSAFHLMGLGVSTFMRSVLGFEKEFMNEANARLLECESRAWDEMKKAQGGGGGGGWLGGKSTTTTPTASATQIYPPGSEYALVHAESQIMLAVVAELHESLTEAIRGFYKLRKAFVSLNGIIESEDAYLRGETPAHGSGARRLSFTEDPMPGAFDEAEFADLEAEAAAEAESAEARANSVNGDATTTDEKKAATTPSTTTPTKTSTTSLSEKTAAISLIGSAPRASSQISRSNTATPTPTAAANSSTAAMRARKRHLDTLTNPVDIFVHSGANLCFGMLLVLISMVPPAFSRLLSIVGFKGDRERGVRMLWQSTKFANIYGGLAGLALLVYYNGLVANADILPTDADIVSFRTGAPDEEENEVVGYPKERCRALLAHMRTLYPDSLLWVLEEARLLSTDRKIKEAIAVLKDGGASSTPGGDGKPRVAKMRQITALTKFELAIDSMCAMEWETMRDAFSACVELNTWSHALYYYNVGCAELELYRTAYHRAKALAAEGKAQEAEVEATTAAKHKKSAEAHLRKAPTMAGKKKFMARQMPFDVFVIRKLARWEDRAKRLGVDLADAVGVSPALEMAYLWGSAKRLPADLLEQALTEYLPWERCTAEAGVVDAFKAAPDESGIGSLCKAALLRALGRREEALDVLNKELFIHDRTAFKGPLKDDYVQAAGHYEAAVVMYMQATDPAGYPSEPEEVEKFRKARIDESFAELDKVAKWETFVLDARIGMKLQTGLDTIKWLKEKKGWA